MPSGARKAGGKRGTKNPGTPKAATVAALKRLRAMRTGSIWSGTTIGIPEETRSQNSRSRSTRFSGALPAINAALIAPIDTPVSQSGARLWSCIPSYTPAWYAPKAPPPCSSSTVCSCSATGGVGDLSFFLVAIFVRVVTPPTKAGSTKRKAGEKPNIREGGGPGAVSAADQFVIYGRTDQSLIAGPLLTCAGIRVSLGAI